MITHSHQCRPAILRARCRRVCAASSVSESELRRRLADVRRASQGAGPRSTIIHRLATTPPHGTRESFEPRTIEEKWYSVLGVARASSSRRCGDDAAPYCIQLPPPNVTGTLHMGHAFQQTLMDVLIRWHRMRGDNTLWQVGTDHAGIATQIVVEQPAEGRRQVAARSRARAVRRARLGVEGRVRRRRSRNQMRRLGASADWSRERFTMDEGLSAAVRRDVRAPLRRRAHLSRQAARQLGPDARHGGVRPRSRQARRSRASCGRFAIRSPMAPGVSSSRRRDRRRCWATWRSP